MSLAGWEKSAKQTTTGLPYDPRHRQEASNCMAATRWVQMNMTDKNSKNSPPPNLSLSLPEYQGQCVMDTQTKSSGFSETFQLPFQFRINSSPLRCERWCRVLINLLRFKANAEIEQRVPVCANRVDPIRFRLRFSHAAAK